MTVIQSDDGRFSVAHDGVCLREGFESSAAAWRWIELRENEVLSPSHKRAEYGFRQSAMKTAYPDGAA